MSDPAAGGDHQSAVQQLFAATLEKALRPPEDADGPCPAGCGGTITYAKLFRCYVTSDSGDKVEKTFKTCGKCGKFFLEGKEVTFDGPNAKFV